MEKRHALEKIKKWYRFLGYLSIIFAFITFLLFAHATGRAHYFDPIPLILASLTFTLTLSIISISVRKIYYFLNIE